MAMILFKHKVHPHVPVNISEADKAEHQGINDIVAEGVTKAFGTMFAFYVLVAWMFLWMILAGLDIWLFKYDRYPFPFLLFCSNLIQLWALPVLAVGQRVIGRKQDKQAVEQFETTTKTYHDTEQIMQHLDVQDDQLQGHTKDIQYIAQLVEDLQSMLLKQTALIEQSRQQTP